MENRLYFENFKELHKIFYKNTGRFNKLTNRPCFSISRLEAKCATRKKNGEDRGRPNFRKSAISRSLAGSGKVVLFKNGRKSSGQFRDDLKCGCEFLGQIGRLYWPANWSLNSGRRPTGQSWPPPNTTLNTKGF
ncbi:hypothetical protein BpHYR1_029351 [Brachionus plicatilis]|uniref:Uncharacterized protein n=1 Tax=Brachionus plicatilis TaxID=10195 RepID=A0A3M7R5H2_BRAPC|nr:hypothetical protein BpHYR1_029351 [Brachionus plicatilis]